MARFLLKVHRTALHGRRSGSNCQREVCEISESSGKTPMTPAQSALRVLVVDDELLLRWSLAEVLRRDGHTVWEAQSASTAREAITSAPGIDVVLLDHRLPDSEGLGLLQEIRTRMPLAAVVLMTAFATPEIIHDALELGAYSVMTKPFDMHAVEEVVLNAHHRIRHH